MDNNNRPPSFFFITGVPKSGTTWMPMLLNTHQNIFCRPEDKLSVILNSLLKFLKSYNDIIEEILQHGPKQLLKTGTAASLT